MVIREYNTSDLHEIIELFYNTVHTVNATDYTKEQLNVWASGKVDTKTWNRSFLEHYTLVAIDKCVIVGFGDIDKNGYLDRLYVHKDYQGIGIASSICDKLEARFSCAHITTHASITAKPFFEARGYRVLHEQLVIPEVVMSFEANRKQ